MRYQLKRSSTLTLADLAENMDGTFSVEIDGQRHHVSVVQKGKTTLLLDVGGRLIRVDRQGERTRVAGFSHDTEVSSEALDESLANSGRRSNSGVLKSPMPGRILRVLVEVGDSVTPRAPVLIIEAMKMENQLFAPIEGRIDALSVEAGQTVEAGAELLRVVPE